jgi:endonuclease YncB( thermonuclease family)
MYPKPNLILVLTTLVTACSESPPITDTFAGTVTKVHDGDSIHITPEGEKRVIIRLAGIDAPEIKQPFGIASRDKLRSMILNRPAEARCHKKDKYRRQVCVVYFNGDDVNLQMVRAGMAWHYKEYQNEQSRRQRRQYSKAENKARSGGLGLWGGERIAPWEFRRMH